MNTQKINEFLQTLAVKKLTLENIVSELIDAHELGLKEVIINPESSSEFNFERDVLNFEHSPHGINFHSPRAGFYDRLPEQLFHRAPDRTKKGDEWAEIKEEAKEQEKDARAFFLPFDNKLNHLLIQISRDEKAFFEGRDHHFTTQLLKIFIGNSHALLKLTHEEELILLLIIIQAHQIAGSLPQMQQAYQVMLGTNVKIGYEDGAMVENKAEETTVITKQQLGVNTILAGKKKMISYRLINIEIGPIPSEDIIEYIQNQRKCHLLNVLHTFLIPIELDFQCKLSVESNNAAMILSQTHPIGIRIGLNSILTN